jgi:hypothetical protein
MKKRAFMLRILDILTSFGSYVHSKPKIGAKLYLALEAGKWGKKFNSKRLYGVKRKAISHLPVHYLAFQVKISKGL